MMEKSPFIKNSKAELLYLSISALKSRNNVQKLECLVKSIKMIYLYEKGFKISKQHLMWSKFANLLEEEIREDREFYDYYIRTYCTDQDEFGKTRDLS